MTMTQYSDHCDYFCKCSFVYSIAFVLAVLIGYFVSDCEAGDE